MQPVSSAPSTRPIHIGPIQLSAHHGRLCQTPDLSQGVQHFPSCAQSQAAISLTRHYLSPSLDWTSALDLCILWHLPLTWAEQVTPRQLLPAWRDGCQDILLNCLHPGLFSFQQILRWWKSPRNFRFCEHEYLSRSLRKALFLASFRYSGE